MSMPGREAVLLLCAGETLLGALPPLPTELPWWPEAWDVCAAAKARYGLDVVVLRLLTTSVERMPGGTVTYLAEVDPAACAGLPLTPWDGADPLAPHPLRQAWARPGGPQEQLRWARERLAASGIAVTGPATQVKTWNLSAVWRMPTDAGELWFKVVPDFFAHEGAIMSALGPPAVPAVYAAEPGRTIMANVSGSNFDAAGAALPPMIEKLVELQADWIGRADELLTLGLPDRRLTAELPRIEVVVSGHLGEVPPDRRDALLGLVDDLPRRFAAIEACGVPDTLTHGDFHPGNVLGRPGGHAIMDWGDSCLSHPLTDELAFARPLSEPDRALAGQVFGTAWRRVVPGCDPERAATLLRPVLPLLAAVTYATFCARIEPDERIYHAADVGDYLRLAATEAPELRRSRHR
ncbi:MAG: aminoglycoside phosphotransferase family protein [Micropruina sp.]|uniref:aminoglycoside phosphotransferase family protein n=1 Tax=Micropruina sp. TaxID=2737536 RepID=UPI0039E5612D